MCGIVAWVDWELDLTAQEPLLWTMVRRLAHRGPDAEGLWVSRHAALGHRRLVVLDPRGGGQPMVRPRLPRLGAAAPLTRLAAVAASEPQAREGAVAVAERRASAGDVCVISYNGELYNLYPLRAELQARGQIFASRSDVEVLLRAYLQWGPACVEHLDGIFAFAIWDAAAQTLFAARDRLGVKPLFFARRGAGLLLASELKALLAHPQVPAEVDAEGLAEVLALGPARTPGHGVFRGVAELRPGHCLTFDRRALTVQPYWSLVSQPHRDDAVTTAGTVRELLTAAVQRQLIADVPVCTLLSGGLDSSAVTALAAPVLQGQGRGPLHTYAVDFADAEQDFRPDAYYPDQDGPWVQRMAAWLGTAHHTVVLDAAQQAAALAEATAARDLPGMADVDSSLLLFCRQVRRGATVALSGEAADEIFGGYPWCHWEEAITADTFPWARAVDVRQRLLSPEVAALIRPVEFVGDRYREALAEVPRLEGERGRAARMREILYLNISRFLPTLLERKDRMSMASGLEVRVPFCDHRLVQYVWNVPWELKTLYGQPKGILRQALQGLLPPEVLQRRKTPYPRTHSPRYRALVQAELLRVLEDPASPLRALLDVPLVQQLAREGAERVHWFGQTMAGAQFLAYLLQVDIWMRHYRVRVVGLG